MISPELIALQRRVEELEARLSRPTRRARLGAVLVVGALLGFGTALAADGNCPNGYPFCFTADSPAIASQVNHNFAQAREWLETKVGPISSSNVTTSGVVVRSGGDLTLQSGRVIGTNGANNLHIDNSVTAGRTYLNWFGGTGGVTIGNGAQAQAAHFDSIGTLTVGNGVRGAGNLCVEYFDCQWQAQFGCGAFGVCSAGRVMTGFRDGTSCGVQNEAHCCRLRLTSSC
ncbi:MAG TPA: hypothetical protein VGD87_18110 [Archangium sp.]